MHFSLTPDMHKKTILVELPAEIVDKLDRENTTGDRSSFVSNLLDAQLKEHTSMMPQMDASTELTTRLHSPSTGDTSEFSGEVKLTNKRGLPMGTFNINTVEGFEQLAEKIATMSDDPLVRMKARKWL